MIEQGFLNNLIVVACVILAIGVIFGMIRAILGPRFTDRIIAVNIIGTITIIIMCLLSVYYRQDFLVDIAVVYALLSFIAIVVLTRLVIVRRLAQIEHEQAEEKGPEGMNTPDGERGDKA